MKRQNLHIYLMQLYKNIIKFVFTGLTLTACLRINKLFNTHKRVVQNTRKISMHFVQGMYMHSVEYETSFATLIS